jgi:hypothetical protein
VLPGIMAVPSGGSMGDSQLSPAQIPTVGLRAPRRAMSAPPANCNIYSVVKERRRSVVGQFEITKINPPA